LYSDVVINAGLRVEVPNNDRVNLCYFIKFDEDPLLSRSKLNVAAFGAFFVTVGDVLEFTNDWEIVAGSYVGV